MNQVISHPKITKVYFKPITANHEATLFEWRNSPEVYKWCRQNDLLTQASHAAWFHEHGLDKSIKMYMIFDSTRNIPVGVCGLTDIDLVNQRAEFSLYIAPNCQGHGWGKEGLRLLLWHGFNSYPFQTIWGESFDGNPAIGIFKSLGFKHDGTRRDFYFRDGKHLDAYLFSIKRSEYTV